jgi:hypothetical protein
MICLSFVSNLAYGLFCEVDEGGTCNFLSQRHFSSLLTMPSSFSIIIAFKVSLAKALLEIGLTGLVPFWP